MPYILGNGDTWVRSDKEGTLTIHRRAGLTISMLMSHKHGLLKWLIYNPGADLHFNQLFPPYNIKIGENAFGAVIARSKSEGTLTLHHENGLTIDLSSMEAKMFIEWLVGDLCVKLPAKGLIEPQYRAFGKPHPAEADPFPWWRSWGFTVLTIEENFGVTVILPVGWTYHPDEDQATLMDEEGRARAFLTIPAPERDRASIIPWSRFSVQLHLAPSIDISEPQKGDPQYQYYCYKIIDHRLLPSMSAVYASGPFNADDDGRNPRSGDAIAKRACHQWLNTNWPEWGNPFAYWLD